MTDVATLIADMVREGVSAEIIGRVAAALAQREAVPVVLRDEQADRRREKDRERKQNAREGLRNSAESADSAIKKEIPPTPPKEKNIYNTPEHSDECSPPTRSRRKPETPLPADYPTAEQLSAAESRAKSSGVSLNVRYQAERFRNWAKSKDHRCRDWDATWRNWIISAIDRLQPQQAQPPPPNTNLEACVKAFQQTGIWHPEWGEKPSDLTRKSA